MSRFSTVVRGHGHQLRPDGTGPCLFVSVFLWWLLSLLARCFKTYCFLNIPGLSKDNWTALPPQMHASVSRKRFQQLHSSHCSRASLFPWSHASANISGEARRPGQAPTQQGRLPHSRAGSHTGPLFFTHHGAGVLLQFSLRNSLFVVEEKVSEKVLWHREKSDIEHSRQ